MALIVISKDSVDSVLDKLRKEDRKCNVYYSAEHVQDAFCRQLEFDDYLESSDPNKFLCKPAVVEYLASIDVKYDYSKQRVLSNTLRTEKHKDGRFVTNLAYYVQAACLMLFNESVNDFLVYSYDILDPKFSAFLLQRKNVYFVCDNPAEHMLLWEFIDNGVEVVYHGKSFPAYSKGDALDDLFDFWDYDRCVSRELDNEVFENYLATAKVHYPCRMSLGQFTGSEEDRLLDIEVVLKGEFNFEDEEYRRYPMHRIYKIRNEWYYAPCNSCKHPDASSILQETFLSEDIDYFDGDGWVNVSEANEVFSLVLNCDESCDARHYWEHVSFIGKYNKQSKTITMLNKHEGLLEFHDLLQKSKDMSELNK